MNLWYTAIFAGVFVVGLAAEIVGVARKQRGDTITENWRWVERWLPSPLAWLFRVLTGGILMWAILHFLNDAP